MREFEVATDGACLGNPGPGGWAAIVRGAGSPIELANGEARTTNNRMELRAAIEALRYVGTAPARVTIVTDSQYLRQGITKWVAGWQRKGWRTVDGSPVKNRELWEELVRLAAPHDIHWQWTRGHAGHPDNERCDVLSRDMASRAGSGRLPPAASPAQAPREPAAAPEAPREPTVAAPKPSRPPAAPATPAPPAQAARPARGASAAPAPAPRAAQLSLLETDLALAATARSDAGTTPAQPGHRLPAPPAVIEALIGAWRAEVACERDGEVLRLRTPHVLPNGERLEVWLSLADEGITVGDGGYAAEQVEVRLRGELDPAAAVLPPLARQLDLVWDDRTGVLGYTAPDVVAALRQVPLLVQAVSRAMLVDDAAP